MSYFLYDKINTLFNSKVFRYFFVGGSSTLIHLYIATSYIYFINDSVFHSNIVGFLVAYIFSYLAQSRLVFQHKITVKKAFKYFVVQFSSLLLAIFSSGLLTSFNSYLKTLTIVVLLPIITFFIHKFWTFSDQSYASKVNHHSLISKYWLKVFFIFLSSRVLILVSGTLGIVIFSTPKEIQQAFCQWDCGWYLGLIRDGYDLAPHGNYDGDAANWAFFPVFPKAVEFISYSLSTSILSISYILNNTVFFLGLYFLFLYIKENINKDIAITAILLMAFSPYSLYFSVPYTESFFFMFMVLTFYCLSNRSWIYAGIFAALLSGTRAVGVMIVFPMIIMAIQQFGYKNLISFKNEYSYKVLLSIFLAPMGIFLYMNYLYWKVGDAFAFKHIQVAWKRDLQNPFKLLYDGLVNFWTYDFYCALLSLLGIILSFTLFYKKKYAESIFMILSILIPLSTELNSMPRYIFSLFPMYLAIALLINKNSLLKTGVLLFFSAGLTFMSISWVTSKAFVI